MPNTIDLQETHNEEINTDESDVSEDCEYEESEATHLIFRLPGPGNPSSANITGSPTVYEIVAYGNGMLVLDGDGRDVPLVVADQVLADDVPCEIVIGEIDIAAEDDEETDTREPLSPVAGTENHSDVQDMSHQSEAPSRSPM
ncbi:hypothetical protein C0995_004911 [Termitomyces sp. Mi166|nr:hypothetical protein C0995_004911 [Termitomyces sp. Mi166\